MEKELVMYMHAGSGNHGCEAIVNSVCRMIKEKVVLVSYRGWEDEAYSLRGLCRILNERSFDRHRAAHVLYYLYRRLTGDAESFIRYRYQGIFGEEPAPLAVSIGGDNYCYENMLGDLRLANSAFARQGTATVLLGCSIEPELLSDEELRWDLSKYHTILARESITYEALQEAFPGGAPRLLLCPDPAFTLEAEEAELPEGFAAGNTVGINISPMIQDREQKSGITMECYRELIRFIISKTDMQIALIPHVVWENNDDRRPLHMLYEEFAASGRVTEVQDAGCGQLKGIIGRCRFFVGARTHATIAAYSSCVPTLTVGYSVKAGGIARDLFGTEENYVIPVQSLAAKEDLSGGFQWLMEYEKQIRNRLLEIMPSYRERAFFTGKEVDRLWEELSRQREI